MKVNVSETARFKAFSTLPGVNLLATDARVLAAGGEMWIPDVEPEGDQKWPSFSS